MNTIQTTTRRSERCVKNTLILYIVFRFLLYRTLIVICLCKVDRLMCVLWIAKDCFKHNTVYIKLFCYSFYHFTSPFRYCYVSCIMCLTMSFNGAMCNSDCLKIENTSMYVYFIELQITVYFPPGIFGYIPLVYSLCCECLSTLNWGPMGFSC